MNQYSTRLSSAVRGFSLIEAMVAMVVLTIAILALTTAYPYAFGRIAERDDELQAVSFGQQYLEQVRQQVRGGATTVTAATTPIDAGYSLSFGMQGYPSPGSSASPPPQLPSPGNFTATATFSPTLNATNSSYDVTVTVTWTLPAATSHSVLLQSIVTREAL